jgi:predicted NAD/FAD-dependent oxidoreductase
MTQPTTEIQSIAVIGAGLAGLTVAAELQRQGHEVVVFDKSKGPGGRCATRRNPAGWFDHGAPHAQAVTAQFTEQLNQWQAQGVVAGFGDGRAWVGQPFMNAWMRHAAQGLNVQTSTHIAALEREGGAWRLRALEGPDLRPAPARLFDMVVVATPAEQAAPLLAPSALLAQAMRQTRSDPCWTVMACWPNPLPIAQAVLRNDEALAVLALAVCQDPLPGRAAAPDAPHDGGTRWVLHAGADWSNQNLDATADAVAQRLLEALAQSVGLKLARPSWQTAHRWRYAQVASARPEPFGWDRELQLAACGDAWHAGEGLQGLERAWLSAMAMAGQAKQALSKQP